MVRRLSRRPRPDPVVRSATVLTNAFYLRTKAAKSGHLIDFSGKERLDEQHDRPPVPSITPEQVEPVQPE